MFGRTTVAAGQRAGYLLETHVELQEAARHLDRPSLVAEIPLDLTDDVGSCVGGKRDAAGKVEPVDGLDQADAADLNQVLKLFAALAVAA